MGVKIQPHLAISDRVLGKKFTASLSDLLIIQVYEPVAQSGGSAVEKFYEEVEEAMKQAKSRDISIVMGI